ncbi:TraR/DksA C4-type zinc finger protein [Marinobacterium jannaschii]|uniref:TraR/DksA C4-type zinc finger protein n=1 Tax=Marinobacterium jannaschii TaxID=64970 RepID=UPI00047F5C2D|nr:TraR/DksA C4-type zinc finger protein [Marinobacterium jannaschii]
MADDCDRAQVRIDLESAAMVAAITAQAKASGPSAEFCEECGVEIPQLRREKVPGVRLCVDCQSYLEQRRV